MNNQILRLPDVKRTCGLSNSTIWRLEKTGNFPKRIKISKRAMGWLSAEIDDWINSREQMSEIEGGNLL